MVPPTDIAYMHRCLHLAHLAIGHVAPNPMVGAVLVYNNRIIGEGYHQQYGGPHAEVNCIHSVHEKDRHLISESTLFVSLEPCAHFGKTPPCADLILEHKIPKVIIGCRDPFYAVNGKGIEKLEAAGVNVIVNLSEQECREINKRFFTFHQKHRPYIILKWAQSKDGKIAQQGSERLLISGAPANRLVHKWRSEEDSILVGTNTAFNDNPSLTTRLWPGKNPLRLVVDLQLKLPASLNLFDETVPTIVFNLVKHSIDDNWKHARGRVGIGFYQITEDVNIIHQITNALYQLNIQSVIVEGGAQLLQSFIDEGMWDEARVITNTELIAGDGLPAPQLSNQKLANHFSIASDTIDIYQSKY